MIDIDKLEPVLGPVEGSAHVANMSKDIAKLLTYLYEWEEKNQGTENSMDLEEVQPMIDAILAHGNVRTTVFTLINLVRIATIGHATAALLSDFMVQDLRKHIAMKSARESLENFSTRILGSLQSFGCPGPAVEVAYNAISRDMERAKEEHKSRIQLVGAANDLHSKH